MQVEEARLQAAASEQRHVERAAGASAKHAEEVAFLENQGADWVHSSCRVFLLHGSLPQLPLLLSQEHKRT